MNRKNFETVLEQYISRLAELEQADDSDQVYKWRAVGCFKRFWNLNAADFAGMFGKAMQEAENLLDDAAMQPLAGLRMLLARESEAEYVRECFRFLFSEDDGDLKKRQERAEFFADKINERIRYYERGTKKYLQNRDHVIYYLNLWKPEENYMFDEASAAGWAGCAEYDGDFGSRNFSLESYYKMCDELLEAIRENEELTDLITNCLRKNWTVMMTRCTSWCTISWTARVCIATMRAWISARSRGGNARKRLKLKQLRRS